MRLLVRRCTRHPFECPPKDTQIAVLMAGLKFPLSRDDGRLCVGSSRWAASLRPNAGLVTPSEMWASINQTAGHSRSYEIMPQHDVAPTAIGALEQLVDITNGTVAAGVASHPLLLEYVAKVRRRPPASLTSSDEPSSLALFSDSRLGRCTLHCIQGLFAEQWTRTLFVVRGRCSRVPQHRSSGHQVEV